MGNDRSELHKKVEVRRKELQNVLTHAEREGHPALRIEALRTELSVVENATTGGWDSMAEVTAVELTNWLEATQILLDAKPVKPMPPTVREKPAADARVDGGGGGSAAVGGNKAKPAPMPDDIRSTVANNETPTSNSGNSASELGVDGRSDGDKPPMAKA